MSLSILRHDVELYNIQELHAHQKEAILSSIQEWFPNRTSLPSYLEKRFSTYQYVLLSKKNKLNGIFFIDIFSVKDEVFLYIGSSFAKDFFAYANAFFHIFNLYSEQYKTIHLLSEAQNPTILLHWHVLFPKDTTRSSLNHQKTCTIQWNNIQLYQKYIPHFTSFNKQSFKTTSSESLFIKSKRNQNLVEYLEKQKIFLDSGDSIVLYTAFQKRDLSQMSHNLTSWIKNKNLVKSQLNQTLFESL